MTKFYRSSESGPEELVLTPRITDEQVEAVGVEVAARYFDAKAEACHPHATGQSGRYRSVADEIRALRHTSAASIPDFTAGIEAMRAALVEYFRVWPRNDMTADLISKFDIPSHFMRPSKTPTDTPLIFTRDLGPPAATAESEVMQDRGLRKSPQRSNNDATPLSASEPAGALKGKPLEISRKWCLDAARREGDSEVGAGLLARDPAPAGTTKGLPVCVITGRIAGDSDACGDCDPCGAARVVPLVVQRLLAEKDEWRNKYVEAKSEAEPAGAPSDTVAVPRQWLEKVRAAFDGDLPHGHIGDAAFLLRGQITDLLRRD
jgi:hypothetical protein